MPLIAVTVGKAAVIDKDESPRACNDPIAPAGESSKPALITRRPRRGRVRTTAWIPWHCDQDHLRDEVMHQAQIMVAQAAGSKENIEQAKRSAEVIIGGLYEHVGWTVRIVWQETARPQARRRDLPAMSQQFRPSPF